MLSLVLVHVAILLHVLHWKLSGRTLAPLELNEVMYTLELGIVTAGFVFMALILVSVLLLGRFFCSFGCHVLALQDLSAWLLGRLGIRPRPLRSRVLAWVPLGAMLYMFVWPQVRRVLARAPLPSLTISEERWASFVTDDFWRNLPPPGVALLTLLVCGGVLVWVLGSRSFCRNACPYGALFALADRVAPGRIVSTGPCDACGACTAGCQSGVRVHEELAAYGTVVDPACLKDLDCVAVCPRGSIGYGFTLPSLLRRRRAGAPPIRRQRDLRLSEELLVAASFLASLLVLRGLYGLVPFLLALGLGALSGFAVVLLGRFARGAPISIAGRPLVSRSGRTRAGWVAAGIALAGVAFLAHSGLVRWHLVLGERAYERFVAASGEAREEHLGSALRHLERVRALGLAPTPGLEQKLARSWLASATPERAEPHLWAWRAARPRDPGPELALGELLARRGRLLEAASHFERACALRPDSAPAHYNLAVLLARLGREEEAIARYRSALRIAPEDPDALNNLGFLLAARGDLESAEALFLACLAAAPRHGAAHYNLGLLRAQEGRSLEAEESFERAAALDSRLVVPPWARGARVIPAASAGRSGT